MIPQKEIAFTNTTEDYPIGVHKWYFTDGKCQDGDGNGWRRMNLHGCNENSEFSCKSGDCVNLTQRCDRIYDCEDLSDEQNCTFVKPPDYDKDVSPPQILPGIEELTDINISVNILDIIRINEVESNFQVKFELETTWNDTRLTFISLNE